MNCPVLIMKKRVEKGGSCMSTKRRCTVTIRTSDTGIVIIMLANMEHLQGSMKIWMDLGLGNAHQYIEVKLGPIFSLALPALHALT